MRKSENKKGSQAETSFFCSHCGKEVDCKNLIGTKNRNHCPFCLWSKHVDTGVSGDRASLCHSDMAPIALTFKREGTNKYRYEKQGEIMLVHQCQKCDLIRINRLAGDDDSRMVLALLKDSKNLNQKNKNELNRQEITLLGEKDEREIKKQLFGAI